MNFFKRAMLSITRRKSKSLILFAVIFILGNLIAGAISIQQATKNVEENIKKQLGSIAQIELDYKKIQENAGDNKEFKIEELPVKDIKKFGESDSVKYYDYNINQYLSSDTVKPVKDKDEDSGMVGGPMMSFKMKGVQYEDILDFKEKKGKLLEGRTFEKDEIKNGANSAIISKKLAAENNLSIGDTFVLKNEVYDFSGMDPSRGVQINEDTPISATREVALKVVGIFEPLEAKNEEKKADEQKDFMADFLNKEYQNTIYVANSLAEKETQFQREETAKTNPDMANYPNEYNPTYVLKSPEDSEKFKEEITPQLSDSYKITASSDSYNSIAAPIKSMSKLSRYVLIASVGATLLIIGLVVLLFVRDRKHEFGIYLSLGEKRGRVLSQVIIEVAVVAFVAIGLSVFSGNYLAGGISNSMIQSQIEAENQKELGGGTTMMAVGGPEKLGPDLSEEDVANAYSVKLTTNYIILFFTVGMGTILVSTMTPVIYVIRLNPKKIMM